MLLTCARSTTIPYLCLCQFKYFLCLAWYHVRNSTRSSHLQDLGLVTIRLLESSCFEKTVFHCSSVSVQLPLDRGGRLLGACHRALD